MPNELTPAEIRANLTDEQLKLYDEVITSAPSKNGYGCNDCWSVRYALESLVRARMIIREIWMAENNEYYPKKLWVDIKNLLASLGEGEENDK